MDNDFSEKLGSLLSDPSALAKIASLAGSLGLSGASAHTEEKTQEPKHECEICPAKEILPCGGAPCPFPQKEGFSDTAKNIAQSRALLLALKPYLSQERCERIDKILGMMKIAEIMGYLK